jgi:hypothetical protein
MVFSFVRKTNEGIMTLDRARTHLCDTEGKRRGPKKLPRHVKGLVADRYRSLARELRRASGYAKEFTPCREFLWAYLLFCRIKGGQAGASLEEELQLTKSTDAAYLHGWCGPVTSE